MKIAKNHQYQIEKSIIYYIPFFIFIGILLFFKFTNGSYIYSACSISIASAVLFYLFKKNFILKVLFLLSFSISIGFLAANIQVKRYAQPDYDESKETWLYGDVNEIERREDKYRLLLVNLYSRGSKNLPINIRLKTKFMPKNLNIGDRILVKTTILKPPRAVIPGSFDYSEFAFFNNIHSIGYALNKIKIFKHKKVTNINWLRNQIYHKIKSQLDPPNLGLIASLMIGKKTDINDEIYNIMRNTGTAHLLAVSGLHMTVVVAFVYIFTKFLFYGFPNFLNRHDVRKYSAVIAIILSYGFLQITAAPISAQRAFIMASIFLLGILLERKSTILRPISLAATFIMLTLPYAIFMPSFQMSFMACYILIFIFSFPFKLFAKDINEKVLWKTIRYMLIIIITTTLISIALMPFIIFHFNNISIYSVLGNIIAIPLTDFIIMPMVVISLILMPAGLEWLSVKIASITMTLLIKCLTFINNLPWAAIYISQINSTAFAIFAINLWFLCIVRHKSRWIFTVPMMIAIFYFPQKLPDVLIAENNQLIAYKFNGEYYYSSFTKNKFIRQCWQEYLGDNNAKHIREIPNEHLPNLDIITAEELKKFGAHALWFDDNYNNSIKKIDNVANYTLNR